MTKLCEYCVPLSQKKLFPTLFHISYARETGTSRKRLSQFFGSCCTLTLTLQNRRAALNDMEWTHFSPVFNSTSIATNEQQESNNAEGSYFQQTE